MTFQAFQELLNATDFIGNHKAWKTLMPVPNQYVNASPFVLELDGKKQIMYCTDYDGNLRWSGIIVYDIQKNEHRKIKKWADTKYYQLMYSYIYNKSKNQIIFCGGKDAKKDEYISFITIYGIKDNKLKYIPLNLEIGSFPKLLLTHNDNYLHIIGGTKNNYHLIYNVSSQKIIKKIEIKNKCLMGHGAIYDKENNKLIIMGGQHESDSSDEYLSNFLIFSLNTMKWTENKNKMLPTKLNAFGVALYNNYIVIVGGTCASNRLSDIYYSNLSKYNEGWTKLQINLNVPFPGIYHALIVDDDIYVLPYGHDPFSHFSIKISQILPSNAFTSNNNKIRAKL